MAGRSSRRNTSKSPQGGTAAEKKMYKQDMIQTQPRNSKDKYAYPDNTYLNIKRNLKV